ncbi:hypothetical protein PMAYCL1PPCAC_15008, partial [Pristionchus mayeri]
HHHATSENKHPSSLPHPRQSTSLLLAPLIPSTMASPTLADENASTISLAGSSAGECQTCEEMFAKAQAAHISEQNGSSVLKVEMQGRRKSIQRQLSEAEEPKSGNVIMRRRSSLGYDCGDVPPMIPRDAPPSFEEKSKFGNIPPLTISCLESKWLMDMHFFGDQDCEFRDKTTIHYFKKRVWYLFKMVEWRGTRTSVPTRLLLHGEY